MRSKLLLLAICSLTQVGCGTVSDAIYGPLNDQVYYRGVTLDVDVVVCGGPGVLAVADVPFSAVADTVMVPFLAYHQFHDPPHKRIATDGPVF